MARLITAGAELAENTNAPGSPDGAITASTSVTTFARSGSRSYRHRVASNTGQGKSDFVFTGVSGRSYFARIYLYWDTSDATSGAPLSGSTLIAFQTAAGGTDICRVNVESKSGNDITIGLRTGAGVAIGSASVSLVMGAWHRVEVRCKVNTAANDEAELRINGSQVAVDNNIALSATNIGNVAVGSSIAGWPTTGTYAVYVDDVGINDDQGANQNTWPGEGKVVLLVPISDNATGAGWTLGTGTAFGGNGFAGLDNTPPLGVADLAAGSDPKQVRNASANANVNVDSNLTTYTNAGIGSRDTINLLVPIVATAAPVSTSAKQGTIGISSNPAITNIALGAGGTSGAFWSGVAAGTYPTGWKWSYGTTTYAPSVTLGTSPVSRITQVTSSTRIAIACFVGMYVEYSPPPMPPPLVMPRYRWG